MYSAHSSEKEVSAWLFDLNREMLQNWLCLCKKKTQVGFLCFISSNFEFYPKHWTILFFRSQILSISFVKIMSQIQSLSFCGTFSMKWATILSWSRSDHSQSFQKVRFTTKICIFRKYFGMLFFKYILYQKRTKFQAGIVVKKILTKIFANFLKFFVVFDEILPVFISKKDLKRSDL